MAAPEVPTSNTRGKAGYVTRSADRRCSPSWRRGCVTGDESVVLRVDCVIGDFPPSAVEGVRLTAHGAVGGIDFNQEVSGLTLFLP
jgi:hypothetical protein